MRDEIVLVRYSMGLGLAEYFLHAERTFNHLRSIVGIASEEKSTMRQALTQGMMERLGIRPDTEHKRADPVDSELMPGSIAAEYELLVTGCLDRLGLTPDVVRVSVRPVGVNPAGMDIYAAFIKVQRWDPVVVQLLARMPYVEQKVARCIRQSQMLRYSAFVGLWFRTPPHIETEPVTMH
jgi:hypothetical protein